MSLISIVNLADQYRQLTESGKAVGVQWQESESVAFCRSRTRVPFGVSYQPK